MKAIEWWLPPEQRNKRRPYCKGVKAFLTSMEVGESKEIYEPLRYDSIKAIANRLRKDFGCEFVIEDKRIVTRLK